MMQTVAMSHDYAACKIPFQCLFGLDAKILSTVSHHQSPLARKLGAKITCGDCYPPIGCHTKKRYQLSGNVLGLQWTRNLITRTIVWVGRYWSHWSYKARLNNIEDDNVTARRILNLVKKPNYSQQTVKENGWQEKERYRRYD
ncbi:hypothetical protein TNCV_5142011 [Trichonephila clavipes]|nr:hypothetical protein TNCV_5142011 [Trichonephila clavipes]